MEQSESRESFWPQSTDELQSQESDEEQGQLSRETIKPSDGMEKAPQRIVLRDGRRGRIHSDLGRLCADRPRIDRSSRLS